MIRENEDPEDSDASDLDGFEVVDMSSCMNFPAGATVEQKREACRPKVYRYRYPRANIGLGHTLQTGANALSAATSWRSTPTIASPAGAATH